MTRISLNWNDPTVRRFAQATFPEYNGRHFYMQVVEGVDVTNSYWSEGSRSTFAAFTLSIPPRVERIPNHLAPQFGGPKTPQVIVINPGFGVAEFREGGRWEYLTFYLNAADAVPLLPSGDVDLSEDEKFVLAATVELNSAGRKNERERRGFSKERWDAAAEKLKERGFLDKRGAATVDGKNTKTALKLRAWG